MFGKFVIVLLAAVIAWAVFARASESARHPQLYRVKSGDTLWSIAAAHYAGDPRSVVAQLQARNRLANSTVYRGQRLVLP